MSISVFKKWTSAVLYLNEKIKNNRLIAGRNIKLEDTGSGIRIHGSAENTSSGDSYNGYFKIIKDGDNHKIIDGSDAEALNCGYVVAGNSRMVVLKTTIAGTSITTDGVFYIETTYIHPDYKPTIKFASTLPDAVDGRDIRLIADLKDKTIIQRLHGEHVIARWV